MNQEENSKKLDKNEVKILNTNGLYVDSSS